MTDEVRAKETPLLELARRVPKDLRAEWVTQRHDDGTPCGHTMAPVGRYIHQMADYIEQLDKDVNGLMELLLKDRQRIEQLEAALNDIVAADHCEGGEYCPHCIARDALAEDRE